MEVGYRYSKNVIQSFNKQKDMAYAVINLMGYSVLSVSFKNTKSTPKEVILLRTSSTEENVITISKDGVKLEA